MLYVNQSYNYLIRKRSNYIEPIKLSCNTDYNKQHKGNSQQTAPYTLVKDLITKYGKSWLNLNIPQFLTDQKEFAVNNRYLSDIEEYMQNNGLNQFSIVANIKNVYNGLIIENDRNAIKPYELDIYLPDLNLAIEYNSIKYHSIKEVGNAYYHIKKSIRCRRVGIRLIHIYEFEDFDTQIQLLQDLILGQDNYPKSDFNKNNLLDNIPKPSIIYNNNHCTIYGAGKLIS